MTAVPAYVLHRALRTHEVQVAQLVPGCLARRAGVRKALVYCLMVCLGLVEQLEPHAAHLCVDVPSYALHEDLVA